LNYRRGLGWYRACFRNTPALRTAKQLTFDSAPYYIFHPAAPARTAADPPDVKIIALLRDPARRAFSHCVHERSRGRERSSFEQALQAEDGRLQGEEQRLRDQVDYNSFTHQRFSYRARGHCAEQLERWLKSFDRERILILKSEDLFADPTTELERVWAFLNIAPIASVVPRHQNQTTYRERVKPDTLARLTAHFREANRSLPQIAGPGFVR